MKNIYVKIINENDAIKKQFKNKDIVSIKELLDKIEELNDHIEYLEEKEEERGDKNERNK